MYRIRARNWPFKQMLQMPVLGQVLQRIRMWRRHYYFHRRMLCKKRKYRKYEIGYGSYGDLRVVFENSRARLFIGRFCAIGDGVTVFLGEGEHRTNWLTTYDNIIFDPFDPPATKGDVRIGSDVWMCTDAAILSGVNIGNGAIIGAKAVVAKDVPPYAIVVGNPARVVSYRFDERTISILERIAWWDWPLEKIEEAWPLLSSDKVDAFIERYGPDQNMSGPSR